jgi:hypothetical protein
MALYTTSHLEGLSAEWWNAYTVSHAAPNTINWQEFRDSFHVHHIPSGMIKLKQREFLALKQGNMSVNRYLDKFTQSSRYAQDEVNTDPKRQECFLDSLIEPLNYQLQSHSFPDFTTLLNKAKGLEDKRAKLGEQKRKFQSRGQSSNAHPRFNSSQSSQFSSGGSSVNYLQNSQLQRSTQQFQHFSQQTLHVPNHHRDHLGVLMRNDSQVHSNGCFNYGELERYASIFPNRNIWTPQKDNGQKFGQPTSQIHHGSANSQINKGQ